MDKRIMTLKELSEYSGYAESYLYKQNCLGKIPGANKPGGKKLFFDREKIDKWLLGDSSIIAEQKQAEEKKK